jgi:hypothetical protein
LVNDDRTPQEKLAEVSAVNEALLKQALESGDVNPNQTHQTQKSLPESDPPATVSTDDSGTGVGAGNAIPSEETNTPGTSLDAGESGSATSAHQLPKSTVPTEKPNPQDSSNAMETNQQMMMPEQPEDVLKQPGGDQSTGSPPIGSKTASSLAKMKKTAALLKAAADSRVPAKVALAAIRAMDSEMAKMAEDALNPAQISAGTIPVLQQESGVPSQLMQGSEAGSNTPRESAPTTGEASGRQHVQSVESAINMTKGQAKTQNSRSALSELLTEPAMSASGDSTLQKSLDNTSSAGVKISAARELLRRFAESSPDAAQKFAAAVKAAQEEEEEGKKGKGDKAPGGEAAPGGEVVPGGGAALMGGEASSMPEDEVPPEAALEMGGGEVAPPMMPPMAAEGGEGVPPEAMAAAEAEVTPEELAQAAALLAAQAEGGEAPLAAPEAVADEKDSQMGGAPMGGGAGMAAPPPMPMT